MSAKTVDWRFELPATLEAAERVYEEFRLWRLSACAGLDLFSAELLFREALTNSVVHGCMEDPNQRISCVLRVKPGRLLIVIQDQGNGFDWRSAREQESGLAETHGRGTQILKLFATLVRYSPKGNVVLLIKRFSEGETI